MNKHNKPQDVEVELEPEGMRLGVRFMRALALLFYYVCVCIERVVRFWVRLTAFISVRAIYVLLPVLALVAVIGAISHGYMFIESRAVSEAHAVYMSTVDYLAEKHGYSVNFSPSHTQEESYQEHSLENVIHLVRREMKVNGIPYSYEPIVLAMFFHESVRGNPYATSSAGAKGIAQIMDATARQMGYEPAEMYNLEKGIIAGVKWFRMMLDSQGWDLIMALKEYNAGEKRIDKTHENRAYPHKVLEAVRYVYDEKEWTGLRGVR